MRITFDHQAQVNTENTRMERTVRQEQSAKAYGNCMVAFDGKDRVGFGIENTGNHKGKAQAQLPVQGTEADVQNMRNQLTVMSHTMSEEDFAKMQEEGYDPSEIEPEEAVTILDKIKSELVKAGVHVAGYTDSMDMDTLAAALGNEVLAQSVVSAFAAQDIPVKQENLEQVVKALDMAAQLGTVSESTYYYMAENEMTAVLKDFYLAAASGSQMEKKPAGQYFGEAVKGYITKNVDVMPGQEAQSTLNIENEIDKLLERLGLENTPEEKNIASWLVEKGLPVDADTIARMKDVFAVRFPLTSEHVIKTAAAAIADGIPVEEKNLADPTSYVEKAVAVYEKYQGEDAYALVQDRRKLEEVRLHMTVETNLKLLKSGFAIDTAPIEEAIEALKNAERELAKQYFPQAEDSQIKYQAFKETQSVVRELPTLPAATIGSWTQKPEEGTLKQFHAEGKALESAYQKAGERYETVWTAPRADMGDSIRKAFANVDEILKDYAYELSDENRKAVRILGYNRMEITPENIDRVKAASETVEQVVRQMTPAATLKMIRDGVNPLEKTLPQLQEYFEQLPEEYAQTSEKYSRFLYRLEHAGELTAQEKDAFIGCYRLLNQMEKSDGAAIGTLVNVGAELNFQNLLSAVRTGKFKGLDARVDDMLGSLSEETVMKLSISEQIQSGYAQSKKEVMQEAAKAPAESYAMLERGQIPATAQNIMAATVLEKAPAEVFGKSWQKAKRETSGLLPEHMEGKIFSTELWQKLESREGFEKEYAQSVDTTQQNVEEVTIEEADTTVDVKELQMLSKQLHIMRKLSMTQEYYFPMEIAGETTGVHLQFTQGENKGLVRITMESAALGRISGALQVTEEHVSGYFVGNRKEVVMNLKKSSDIVNNSLGEEWKFCEVEFVYSESNHIPMDWTRTSAETQVDSDSLYRLSKNFLQVVKAVGDARSEEE